MMNNLPAHRTKADTVYADPAIITNEDNNNEVAHHIGENEVTIRQGTTLQQFYAGQSIFITGGTGFLGHILIEKLLRSCSDLSTIYLLVRPKKGKDIQNRLEQIFTNPIFNRLKEEVPKFRHKVVAVAGDCSAQDLGLSSADRTLLIRNVSTVFHVAATVRFDEKLKLATAINIRSTGDIIDLCKHMPKLKAFIHVSTAYANSHLWEIDERFYNYPIKHNDLSKVMECLPDNVIDEITPRIIGSWPNTYAFTKAIAEDLVKEKNKGLPMGIFRPAIVVSTANEPIDGWINNLYGPTGVVAGAATGLLRTLYCDANINANIVPVDLAVNALIVSAWDVATQTNKRDDDMLIYNYVSSVEAPLTWGDYCETNLKYGHQYPLSNSIWYLSFRMNKHKIIHLLYVLFLHLLPALLVDTVSICFGQKPRLWKGYQKIHKFATVIEYFCNHEWKFTNDNVQAMWLRLDSKDQQLFRFSMKGFDWQNYFSTYMKGIRLYLFNEDLSTLETSRARWRKFYWMHKTLKTLIFFSSMWIIWRFLSIIFF
ncbi:fatty acyl-CoA reductase wat isoform X2 [Cephus cinctus]|uniref:Fatty acyl-CoA reductase n=1 Tax=Cephus cinctus TaxID=211228 RepID=A0AAJ7FDN4_CEPCN|nr:fatty acyl-CoA reductase wat isoform X2 [Cephus cinctus]XP_015586612.1 fatty acyl-CoA reductase wat isoform X2 [Cephus cinctus]XP_015586613.1 fatty acyl-CoA reductase wat isoform X2 [Cephus cinctus]XP_024936805.1 fatty acyl-CoA reductase wat isoform X2 [Cephus cinctus]